MISQKQIAEIADKYHSGLGAPPRVSTPELILGSTYHELMKDGTKAQHLEEVTGQAVRDASLAERFQTMDESVFIEIMDLCLKPQAQARLDPGAFYKGLRLVGIDGGAFSLPNTAAVKREVAKAAARRGEAAFAKLEVCVATELGLHNPIAAEIRVDSEMGLARGVFPKLPFACLCLGDRYYGNGRCISRFMDFCQQQQQPREFLFRVKEELKSRLIQRQADGSALVEVCSTDGQKSLVREIRGKVLARNGRRLRVRLWTSLTDHRRHPARKLLELYAMRWEQEITFDELKNKLHRGNLLKSHTLRTAIQEVAALVIAQSMVAQVRRQVGHDGAFPTLRVSFGKTLRYLQAFWLLLEVGEGIVETGQISRIGKRLRNLLLKYLTPSRRNRSCPRAVRQPIKGWPRLQKNASQYGKIDYEVSAI